MAYFSGLLVPQIHHPPELDQLALTVCGSGAKEGASANKRYYT